MIIIAGPNGSGKTSVTKRFLHHEWAEGTEYINPDEVANDMFGDWNSKEAVLSAANYCAEWREKCLTDRKSFVFETVMSAMDKVDFIARAKKCGYFIRLFFISTESPKINAARIADRVMQGGHDVPITKIVSRYYKSIQNCKAVSSSKGERQFAHDLDDAREVVVYAKLPRIFQIPTPVGNYAPDWAIAMKRDGVRHIFFIAETKGSLSSMDLTAIEKAKINCAEKLFNSISSAKVKYHKVATYQDLIDEMNSVG